MIRRSFHLFLAFLSGIILFVPSLSFADNLPPLTSPETAQKFKQFRQQAGKDFLLPQVFKNHPGVTYILSHATDLNLTKKQIDRLKTIRRKMIDRSLSQMKTIDKLRDNYLDLASRPNPSSIKIHKMLGRIGLLMARATADHLEGHLKAASVLTKDQKSKLSSLK
ncbi:MAG: hypothetical protein ACYC9S_12715 [Leptospirales bacterium]